MQSHVPVRRLLRALALVLSCLCLTITVAPPTASAAVSGCRADPIAWLSNETRLAMTVSIAADPSQVQMITYTVHAPRGLATKSIVYTGGALQAKERVVMFFDRTSGYTIEMRVDLGKTVAAVTATAAVGYDFRTLSGSSSTPLLFQFP
jgi:hypothetical protein